MFFMVYSGSAFAQLTISRSDFGAIGDHVIYAVDTPSHSALNPIVLTTGANKTWNFSNGVMANKYDSCLYTAPGSGAPAAANLLMSSRNGNQYQYVDSNFVKVLLDRPNNNVTGLTLKIFSFPASLGTVSIDSINYYKIGTPLDFNAPTLITIGFDSVKAIIKAYDTTVCTGSGVIILPDSSANVLQVKIITVSTTYLMGHTPSSGWSVINSFAGIPVHQKIVEYQWIGKNLKGYIARASMDTKWFDGTEFHVSRQKTDAAGNKISKSSNC